MAAATNPARYEELLALPPDVIGQIVDGVLHAHPRPATAHALATSGLGEELGPPFKRGKGGPGGWVILDAPELHLVPTSSCPTLQGGDGSECHRRRWSRS